jgi:fermentation-respiration switch protein FrsA (DUF1100 family)
MRMKRDRDKRYWRNLTLFTLFAMLLGAAFIVSWLAYTRAMIFVHPERTYPKRTPSDLGVVNWEEARFPSADGLELVGWYIPPDPQGDGATLVYVHGLGSNREELLGQAVMLTKRGYGALLFDLRNHGESEGTITTLGYAEVEDVRGAVDYLLARAEVDPERIGLVGRSLGGAVVLRAAARIEQVRLVIAQSAYASVEDNMEGGVRAFTGLPPFPFAPLMVWIGQHKTGLDIRQMRPIDDVPQISPRAIMLIHGQRDPAIHFSNSVRLYEAAGEPKELYLIPRAGHGGLWAAEPGEFERRMVDFLERHLRD